MQLARDRLDQVLQRHDALHLAVLVDHAGQVRGAGAELVQQFHAGDALGHVELRFERQARALRGPVAQLVQQPAARAHDAEHLIQPAPHQREARESRFADAPQVFLRRQVEVETDHFGARHHQRADPPVVETEQVAHHGVLLQLDHAGAGAFGEHGVDLVLGHRRRRIFRDAQHAQQRMRRQRQQAHERPRGDGQPIERPRDQARNRLRVCLRDAFRHQFANDDGGIGDEQHHQSRGRIQAVRRARTQRFHPQGQRHGQCRFADDAVQHADRGDADLDRRQEARGVRAEPQGSPGSTVTGFEPDLQPSLACGEQRDFR